MLNLVAIIAGSGFLFLFIYDYILIIRIQNEIYHKYPKEAEDYLGLEKVWGINQKQGILFLWDDRIKAITIKNNTVNSLRKKAIKYFWFFIAMMFSLPLCPLITWIVFLK